MTRQVESCQPHDSLERAVEILSASNVGAILVIVTSTCSASF